ncbi:MAG: hypothetical protein SO401_11175 [Blautia sp.]|nr:hypothetical protein [Blautia sp.]
MSIFNVDYAGNPWICRRSNSYPEWVRREQFYNCEGFGQLFSERKLPLCGLFKNRAREK